MKAQQLNYLMALIFLVGMTFAGCKKDKSSSTDTGIAGTDVAATQDAESQDATADNIDNLTDKLYFTPDADTYATLAALPGIGRVWRLTLKKSF